MKKTERPLLVSCFDVDHLRDPETIRASSVDDVTVVSIGNICGSLRSHSQFIAELCALDRPQPLFFLARINYAGKDNPTKLSKFLVSLGVSQLPQIDGSRDGNCDCFQVRGKAQLSETFQAFWDCFGGNWLIAVECLDGPEFVRCCADIDAKAMRPSEGRDRLVRSSLVAGITFDDSILDFLTRALPARALYEKIEQLAADHGISIKFARHRLQKFGRVDGGLR